MTMRRLPFTVPVLDTGRLLLRAVSLGDIADLAAIYGDPEVMRYASDPAFTNHREYLQTVASIERNLAQDVAIEWGAVLKSSGVLIGVVGLHNFDADQAELGCLLARAHWGQRLMREALLAVLDFAPGVGLTRLTAQIDAGNARSQRLFARLECAQPGGNGKPTAWVKVAPVVAGQSPEAGC